MDAPLALQIVDERIDGRSVERIAPNQKRVKRKAAAQEVVLHVLRDVAVYAAIGLKPDQVRRHAQHVGHVQERRVDQRHAGVEDRLGRVGEAGVALGVVRVKLADLFENVFVVAVIAEGATLVVENEVERIARL